MHNCKVDIFRQNEEAISLKINGEKNEALKKLYKYNSQNKMLQIPTYH